MRGGFLAYAPPCGGNGGGRYDGSAAGGSPGSRLGANRRRRERIYSPCEALLLPVDPTRTRCGPQPRRPSHGRQTVAVAAVTVGGRYQRRAEYARQGDIVTWRGVDAVTGLPVLAYDMPFPPLRAAESLESEHIPGVLATSFDGRMGELVVAFATEYRAIGPADATARSVLAAARALQDAADVGIVHGDLRPARILVSSGHVLVEGYGVPWKPADTPFAAPEAASAPAADVYALCAIFLELGRARLGDDPVSLLERGLTDDPAARPTAAELVRELERMVGSGAPASPPVPTSRVEDAEPLVIDTDPGEEVLKTAPDKATGGFSKEPPPGTRYRSGESAQSAPPGRMKFPSLHDAQILGTGPRRWYRFAVLGATLVLAAILAFLALSRQGDRIGDPTATRAVVYVIDVAVEPANLPPVTLFVTDGPRGSKWQPGTALGNVPGRIVLDREGTWQLQGRFQDRVSQVATLELPAERTVTLTFTPRDSTP